MGRRSGAQRAKSQYYTSDLSLPAPRKRDARFRRMSLSCGRTLLTAVFALASLVVLSSDNALAQGSVATTDREALVALYDATDGSNWTTSTNWKTTAPLKDWSGVTAPAGDSVIILSLVYNNLNGIIPAQLGDLTNLRILRLADNQLTGSIPPELGNLTNLWILYLSNNQLSGSIMIGGRVKRYC